MCDYFWQLCGLFNFQFMLALWGIGKYGPKKDKLSSKIVKGLFFCFYAVILFRFGKQIVFERYKISRNQTQITSIIPIPAPWDWLSLHVGKDETHCILYSNYFHWIQKTQLMLLFILYDKGSVIYFLS